MSDVDLLSGEPVVSLDAPAPAPELAPAPEPEEHKPATPDTSVEATVRAAFKTESDRARDAQGRFAPKADAAPDAPADPKITDQDSKTKPEAPASAPTPSGPPPSWSADAKSNWTRLPPAIQAAVLKREAEVSDGFKQKSEEAKALAPVKEILDGQRDRFTRLGVDASAALRQMFTFQEMFEREPRKLIDHIVRSHGLDLRQLAQTPTATPSPAAATPPARPQIDTTLAYVREEFTRRDAASTLSSFEADPANKHAKNPEVRKAMAGALSAGAADLKAAYEQAIWAVPSVRDELIAERDAAARKAAADKVAAAKAAAVSLRPGSPNGARPASLAPKPPTGSSVEDDVRAAWHSLAAGARQ